MIVRTSLDPATVAALTVAGHGPRKRGADVVPVMPGVCETRGVSQTHDHRLDVLLVGNGRYADGIYQYGTCRPRGGFSPTHDEYGDWCAALFALDPDAVIGPYRGMQAFDDATRYRYPMPRITCPVASLNDDGEVREGCGSEFIDNRDADNYASCPSCGLTFDPFNIVPA